MNAGMSSADFNQLMDQMAMVQVNFEARNFAEGLLLDRRLGEADRRAPRA